MNLLDAESWWPSSQGLLRLGLRWFWEWICPAELHAGPQARDSPGAVTPACSHVHLPSGCAKRAGGRKASTLRSWVLTASPKTVLACHCADTRADGRFTSFCHVQSLLHSQLAPWHLPAQMSPVWVCAGCFCALHLLGSWSQLWWPAAWSRALDRSHGEQRKCLALHSA